MEKNIKQHKLQSGEMVLLVPVPNNITKVIITSPKEGLTPYFHIDYDYDKTSYYTSGGFALFYKDFGGKKKYPKKLELIGISDEITEEQAKTLVREIYTPNDVSNKYENYTGDYFFETAIESFQSLSQSLGCDGRYAVLKEG